MIYLLPNHMCFQLTYRSRAINPFGHISDLDILREAIDHNQSHGITGYLVRYGYGFIQTLEGDQQHLRALYATIRRDNRHTELRILLKRELPRRMFGQWSMGYSELRSEPLLDTQAAVLEMAEKTLPKPTGLLNSCAKSL